MKTDSPYVILPSHRVAYTIRNGKLTMFNLLDDPPCDGGGFHIDEAHPFEVNAGAFVEFQRELIESLRVSLEMIADAQLKANEAFVEELGFSPFFLPETYVKPFPSWDDFLGLESDEIGTELPDVANLEKRVLFFGGRN